VKPDVPAGYQAPSDLEDRLILPLLNESVACLHEGVVADADLLDAGVIFGTGFAPFRGGPIMHVRATGADALFERLKTLQARHGDRFARVRVGMPPPCANRRCDKGDATCRADARRLSPRDALTACGGTIRPGGSARPW
jgi:3-hydroxyacyl-CoA dehydrogenase